MNWSKQQNYTTLPAIFYAFMHENKVKEPKWLIRNERLATHLGVTFNDELLSILAGNEYPEELQPIAQSYAGHQFGHFNMLGDGRAVLLGEVEMEGQLYDIQLKGAGQTPYSRGGDGRAAVGPMLREYLMSEAMFALGIPTTRSLAVVATGEKVQRERLLDGAILTRLASSHIRVGTFEFATRFTDEIKSLADYTIERHYPDVLTLENRYIRLLEKVVEAQAKLIAKWQLVGFVHGVMNTDNMTISGETIDYGPCAFIDQYDLNTVFSSIDVNGRYAFGNQPQIGGWNLARFAETLLSLIDDDSKVAVEQASEVLNRYGAIFHEALFEGYAEKLGFEKCDEEVKSLITDWLRLLEQEKADYTNAFQAISVGTRLEWMKDDFDGWHEQWQQLLAARKRSMEDAQQQMQFVNPTIIPRNYYVDEAIRYAEIGDMSKIELLIEALANPYDVKPAHIHFMYPPKEEKPFITYCGT